MATQKPLIDRFIAEIVPTRGQILICFVIALVVLVAAQLEDVLSVLGIGSVAVTASRAELISRFGVIVKSPVASAAALVAFWAGVGLVAYLVCWGVYNALIEARNEVTLETQYTNRGHWHGPFATLGIKGVSALLLIATVVLLKPGIALWLALIVPLLNSPSAINGLSAILATLGLTLQLYLILTFALLTFTPWYRPEAFTETRG